MATTINIFIFALFEKERSEVLGGEGLFFFLLLLLFSTPFKNSSQGPAASTGICSFASYKRKEKKNICCVWNSSWLLGGVLTGSWLLLTFRDDFLLVPDWFLFSKNRQVYSRSKQEDIKKLLRRRQEAPRHVKKCHEVSKRRRSVKNIFGEKKKSWSFPIDQEYCRSAKKLSRSH